MTTLKDILASAGLNNGTGYNARTRDAYRNAALLGVVAGLRSMLPAALLAQTSDGNNTVESNILESPSARLVTTLAAAGEIIGDKLPVVPSRLKKGSFIVRLTLGAFAGAAVCRRERQPLIAGAILGAAGAGFGTLAGYSVRTLLSQTTDIPDTVWATIEDSVALSLGLRALGKLPTK